MRYLNILTATLALGCSLMLLSGSSFADNAAPASSNSGQIILGDVEGVIDFPLCYIPAIVGEYYLRDITQCTSDDYNAMMFLNVPSALTVTVYDDRNCEPDGNVSNNWEFAVTTVKNPTTSGDGDVNIPGNWIQFLTIWDAANNSVVQPGVMKTRRLKRPPADTKPNLHNEASCVRVERL
ncbi:hypothetical protein [Pseudomonas sp. NFX98]|uniref:hypothetical protein n=1 Tax=Pseudomonas sp. NFX98 TaxID=3399122 RepID=UPI0039FC69B2